MEIISFLKLCALPQTLTTGVLGYTFGLATEMYYVFNIGFTLNKNKNEYVLTSYLFLNSGFSYQFEVTYSILNPAAMCTLYTVLSTARICGPLVNGWAGALHIPKSHPICHLLYLL